MAIHCDLGMITHFTIPLLWPHLIRCERLYQSFYQILSEFWVQMLRKLLKSGGGKANIMLSFGDDRPGRQSKWEFFPWKDRLASLSDWFFFFYLIADLSPAVVFVFLGLEQARITFTQHSIHNLIFGSLFSLALCSGLGLKRENLRIWKGRDYLTI